MNELKPEDVMLALECHSLAGISSCDDCPYCDISEQGDCGCDMARDALALLREKDAKISALQYQADFWDKHAKVLDETISIQQKEIAEKDAEIERLKALNKVLKDNNHQCHRLGYEDAITEFVERLKEHECLPEYPWDEPLVLVSCINRIAKEMINDDEF